LKSRKPSQRLLRELCAEIDPDDGIDPRKMKQTETCKDADYRCQSLCAQIRRALQLSLGQSHHVQVANLYVVTVEPAPNQSRLGVTLQPIGLVDIHPDELYALVHQEAGRLRCDAAAAIHRKRVPTLVYRVAPPAEQGETSNG